MKTIVTDIILSIVTAITVNAQPVTIAAAASEQNSVHEEPSDVQGFVALKNVTATAPMDAKARHNAFLRSNGVDPNMIGPATVVNGRMFVPTIKEQYAPRYSEYKAHNRVLPGASNFPRRPDWWYTHARPTIPLYSSQ